MHIRILKVLLGLGGILFLGAVLFHAAYPPIYRFPDPEPFGGPNWYNPYSDPESMWLRTNFHAHSLTWGGVTRGTHSSEAVWKEYRRLGYDVAGISNYQSIRPSIPNEDLYIPAYEHGFGLWQQHQTVLGGASVSWFDFPLYQGVRHKQCIIDRLKRGAEMLILNHPNKCGSYSFEDLKKLTGYTAIEVASKYARGVQHWDTALSAGRSVWGICSDDREKIEDLASSGWIVVNAGLPTSEAVLDAIRAGNFYGVWARHRCNPNVLRSCEIVDDHLRVLCSEPAESIRFIGQGGTLREEESGQADAGYLLRPEDTYVRVEVITRATTLFLNPVFRHRGSPLRQSPAEVAMAGTLILRMTGGLILVAGILSFVLNFRIRSRENRARHKARRNPTRKAILQQE